MIEAEIYVGQTRDTYSLVAYHPGQIDDIHTFNLDAGNNYENLHKIFLYRKHR